MALSSQSLSKRGCEFEFPKQGKDHGEDNSKRLCLGVSKGLLSSPAVKACYSSSDNDNDLDDEQVCYIADQVKAKRRASSRMSFSVNPKVSLCVSKYSDEDDEHNEESNILSLVVDDNIDCKLSTNNMSNVSSICLGKIRRAASNSSSFHLSEDFDHPHHHSANLSAHATNMMENSTPQTFNKRLVALSSDRGARTKCFEYLVSAIDEAWARYCNATSYTDDEYEADLQYNPITPASIATDDEEYVGTYTDITDYEDSDGGCHKKLQHQPQQQQSTSKCPGGKHQMYQKLLAPARGAFTSCSDISSDQLQALKDRLTKAKYFLQDLVDSDDVHEAASFWKRWDMIKYATIELVEDDDDDEVVEGTIEELEQGRLIAN